MRRSVVGLVIALMPVGCATDASDETTTTGDAAETTTSAVVTTTTTTATTTTTLDEWDSIPTWRGGPAGEYRSRLFEVPFKFTTQSAWTSGGGEATNYLGIAKSGFSGVYFGTHEGTVDEAVAYYQDLTGVEITGQGETLIGGAEGVVLEGSATGNVILGTLPGGGQIGWLAGTRFSLHIVDVGGRTVEVSVDREGQLPVGFEEEAQAILASIAWKDLEG